MRLSQKASACTSGTNCACCLTLDDGTVVQVLGDTSANRVIAAKLVHEEPQKPSDLPEELRQSAASHEPMSKEDKHVGHADSAEARPGTQCMRCIRDAFCAMHVASCCRVSCGSVDWITWPVCVHLMCWGGGGAGSA